MKRWRTLTVVVVGALVLLAACGTSSSNKSKSTTTTTVAPAASSSSGAGVTGSATLGVAMNGKVGKDIVVDASGKTVYLYAPDGTTAQSTVPAGLKSLWPAVTASGTASAGTGLDSSKLKLETQADGTKQASYNGHLLYTFTNDTGPGTANGQGLGGIWFVLSPAGDQIS